MLRQALNDVERTDTGSTRPHDPQQTAHANENTTLTGKVRAGAATSNKSASSADGYGATTAYAAPAQQEASMGDSNQDVDELLDEDDEAYLLEDDEEEDEEVDDDSDDDDETIIPILPWWRRAYNFLVNVVVVIANVENLWDSPPVPATTPAQQRQHHRNHGVVLFWFVVLAASYAGERSTYKFLVDRSGPFRVFAVEMVTATHFVMLGVIMLIGQCSRRRRQRRHQLAGSGESFYSSKALGLGVPIVDVGLMALLDTTGLLLVFLTGYHVPPTLTVILVQFTLPLTAMFSQCVHPDGKCACLASCDKNKNNENAAANNGADSDDDTEMAAPGPPSSTTSQRNRLRPTLERSNSSNAPNMFEGTPMPGWGGLSVEHVGGSLIIFLAVLLSLVPAFYSIANPNFFMYADALPTRTSYNTLLFVSSCVPLAASQLYKEHIFLQYKQPVNMDLMNLLLSLFQFIFASVMAPLVFGLQGLGMKGDWKTLYTSEDFADNFMDGLLCFFRLLPDTDQEHKYPDEARCDFTLGFTVMYAFSIIVVGVAVNKIVNAGATKVMYRGISAGIIVAVLVMHTYDMHIPEFSYGAGIDGLNLVSVILLILGSEVYHRVSLQGSTFETVYQDIQAYYED